MENIYFNCELKALDGEEKGVFEGYASTFGNTDSVGDVIEFGAFAESLKTREPKVLWQHDMKQPIGKLLSIREDQKGLFVKVRLATATDRGREAYELLKADIINTLSIGFMIKDSEFDSKRGVRVIKEAELFEFSLVTIPANEQAKVVGVKSLPENEREFEKFLRDAGYGRSAAKAIVSKGYKGYQDVLREAESSDPDDMPREAEVVKSLVELLNTIKGDS